MAALFWGMSFVQMGWSKDHFYHRLDSQYQLRSNDDGRLHFMGDLVKRKHHQQLFLRCLIEACHSSQPQQIIVLKNRRSYITTTTSVFCYDLVTQVPGVGAGFLAHVQPTADYIFNTLKFMHFRIPKQLRPQSGKPTDGTISFSSRYLDEMEEGDMGLESFWAAQTAGGHFPFSGYTLRVGHITEAGKLQGDAERQGDMVMSVMNSFPPGPSLMVVEGTANGVANWFHTTWARAAEKKKWLDTNEWTPIFIKWTEDPSNVMPVPEHYLWQDWPLEDRRREEALRAMGLSDGQLMFRRHKITKVCKGDPIRFDVDYPITPEVAFATPGSPAIPRYLLEAQEHWLKQPMGFYRTYLEDRDGEVIGSTAVTGW